MDPEPAGVSLSRNRSREESPFPGTRQQSAVSESQSAVPGARLQRNRLGQSGLWGYGISGDLPMVTVIIADARSCLWFASFCWRTPTGECADSAPTSSCSIRRPPATITLCISSYSGKWTPIWEDPEIDQRG